MKIVIAGGTGFLGSHLEKFLEVKGHSIKILSRSPKKKNHIFWDGQTKGDWTEKISGADVIVNLSGKSVDCRYTEKNKNEILRSRLDSTYSLHDYILETPNKPKLWLNASSATTYVHAEKIVMHEENGIIGDDFSMNICKSWEEAFFSKNYPEMRQVSLRTGIVLGNEGGAYPKFKLMAKLGLGGKHGNGEQKISWIHVDDFCRAIDFVIHLEEIEGPINICAPEPTSNTEFTDLMMKKYRIPFGMNHTVAMLEIGAALLGTETELLLKSRNVFPGILKAVGFEFNYNDIGSCLKALD